MRGAIQIRYIKPWSLDRNVSLHGYGLNIFLTRFTGRQQYFLDKKARLNVSSEGTSKPSHHLVLDWRQRFIVLLDGLLDDDAVLNVNVAQDLKLWAVVD